MSSLFDKFKSELYQFKYELARASPKRTIDVWFDLEGNIYQVTKDTIKVITPKNLSRDSFCYIFTDFNLNKQVRVKQELMDLFVRSSILDITSGKWGDDKTMSLNSAKRKTVKKAVKKSDTISQNTKQKLEQLEGGSLEIKQVKKPTKSKLSEANIEEIFYAGLSAGKGRQVYDEAKNKFEESLSYNIGDKIRLEFDESFKTGFNKGMKIKNKKEGDSSSSEELDMTD